MTDYVLCSRSKIFKFQEGAICGYPGDYVAIAKRSGNTWFLGVMNNSFGKSVDLNLSFLSSGNYESEICTE